MASTKDLQKRIKSVQNISQITKAMEVVSMTKMRKSQEFALRARPFALAALLMLKNVQAKTPKNKWSGYFKKSAHGTSLLVVITTDKGLVGGFNDAVFAKADAWIKEKERNAQTYSLITIGKKAKEYFEYRHKKVEKSFTDYGDLATFEETQIISRYILVGFKKKQWNSVDCIYTHFKTTLTQDVKERTLLPVFENTLEEMIEEIIPEYGLHSELRKKNEEEKVKYNFTYRFEPSAEIILESLVEELIKIAFHHTILESNASEHSARMITMKNASENASELKESLTLEMNKARQAGITAEISEIIAGAEALQ